VGRCWLVSASRATWPRSAGADGGAAGPWPEFGLAWGRLRRRREQPRPSPTAGRCPAGCWAPSPRADWGRSLGAEPRRRPTRIPARMERAPRFDQGSGSAPGLREASGRGEESWTSRTIPGDPVQSMKEARARVAAFVDWYNLQHRYSDIRFVTPSQRHSGDFVTIRRHQARVCSNNPAPHTGSPAPTFAQGRLRKIWIALVSCPIGGPDCWLGLDVVWCHGS
jgi:hypothetical protein